MKKQNVIERLLKRLNKIFDLLLPAIKFNLAKKKKSKEEIDIWATEFEEKFNKSRRKKRGR